MKSLVIVLLMVSTLFLATGAQAANTYWVSFSAIGATASIYLEKIDSTGAILVPPTPITTFPPSLFFLTTLTNGAPGELFVWGEGVDVTKPTQSIIVERTNVSTDNFATSTLREFPVLPTQNGQLFSLSSTQNVNNKLLTFQVSTSLKAFGISPTGAFDGRKFRISPRTSGSFLAGGISPDGRMSWSAAAFSPGDKLYLQPLRADGLPTGTPRVAGSSTKAELMLTADITNVLANGTRLAVYYNIGSTSNVYSQIVDGTTGAKLTQRQLVSSSNIALSTLLFNGLVVDPNGAFLLQDTVSTCGSNTVLPIAFQALDSAGKPSGDPIQITDCDFMVSNNVIEIFGIDILEIQ
jgi:hypothetical protein